MEVGKTYFIYSGLANVPGPDLPLATSYEPQVPGNNATSLLINLGAFHYDYLMAKWGNNDYFYYVGALSGEIQLVNDVQLNPAGVAPQGLSHYVLFNGSGTQVPDGGFTAVLFLGALAGLTLLRRPRNA
jgi:MYXO-CTERM domain-containing protein